MWLNIPRDVVVGSGLVILDILWVLLPLVPAILIYRIFPGTPVFASGPVVGLTVRAGGAAAVYLIILLVSFPLIYRIYDEIHGFGRPYWTVHVTADLRTADNKPVTDERILKRLTLSTRPDHFVHDTFTFHIPFAEEIGGRFPDAIIVGIDENWRTSIDLNKEREKKSLKLDDKFNKEIELKDPIIIKQRLTSSGSLSAMDFGSRD